MGTTNRQRMWYGMLLFLPGVVTGLLEERFTNVRISLAAHLEGVMNSTFLVALGAIWNEVRLSPAAKATAYWTGLLRYLFELAGHYSRCNFRHCCHVSSLGSRQSWATLARGSYRRWIMSVSISIVVSAVLVLWGLRAKALRENDGGRMRLNISPVAEHRR